MKNAQLTAEEQNARIDTESPISDTRQDWIVAGRAVAICLIVLIHISDYLVWETNWLKLDPSVWWTSNLYNAIVHGGTGLFVMISGALLLAPRANQSAMAFFTKRILRIAPPYVIWAAVYFWWRIHAEEETLSWSQFPYSLATGSAYYHLWFLHMILELYLLTPLLRPVLAKTPLVVVGCGLVLWFGGLSILPAIRQHLGLEPLGENLPFYIHYLAYLGYFVLGFVLSRLHLRATGMAFAIAGWVGGVALTAFLTWRATVAAGGILSEEVGDHNFYPQVVVLTVCAFLVLRNLEWERLLSRRLLYDAVAAVSGASFTIYLLHALLLEAQTYPFSPIQFHFAVSPWFGIPAIAALVVAECLIFATLVRWLFRGRLRFVGRAIAP